jgi:hypothetical protein
MLKDASFAGLKFLTNPEKAADYLEKERLLCKLNRQKLKDART